MARYELDSKKFLRKSELTVGSLYLWKDGHCRIFLGVVGDGFRGIPNAQRYTAGQLVFYNVGMLALYNISQEKVGILNEPVVLRFLNAQVAELLHSCAIDASAIDVYSSMPQIYTCLREGILQMVTCEPAEQWLKLVGLMGIVTSTKKATSTGEFVRATELEVGRVYYVGQSALRSCFVFLGHSRVDNSFIWCFIGNPEAFVSAPMDYVTTYGHVECTCTNKRVHAVTPSQDEILGNFVAPFTEEQKKFLTTLWRY